MYFKQILDERCGCASYVVASRQTGDAAVIDPALSIDQYVSLLAERDFHLTYAIDTHVHADHISGARKLVDALGGELCLYESAKVTYPFRPLHDGEELPLGQLRLRVLHTPGHRPELCSILIINPERSPEPSMVLTGDSLLVGDVGRPDFGGGDPTAQYESLNRLLRLPDWVAVFPGHFEGPCGKGMCGRPSTTVGFERLYNPLARLDKTPFVQKLTDGIPARPLNMTAIEAANRGVAESDGAMLTTAPEVREISVRELAEELRDGIVIDVREPAEYAHSHVPGVVNLPQADLASRLNDIPRDKTLYTICQGGYRSRRAAQFLLQSGFKSVISVEGGTQAWINAGLPTEIDDAQAGPSRIVESEWAHAGGLTYSI